MRDDEIGLPETVNDVHSGLNRTRVAACCSPRSVAAAARLVRVTADAGRSLAIAGARHAMGGQQFLRYGVLLDTTRLDRVLAFDAVRGTITVEAGMRWPTLLAWLRSAPENASSAWTIRQKQTGADDFSLGGAVAANVHGRGLAYPPFAADVDALRYVDAAGVEHSASRSEDPERFALLLGGYGLFGLVTAVTLRLVPRMHLVRRVTIARSDEVIARLDAAAAAGAAYGDWQLDIDPASRDFCARGVLSYYAPTYTVAPQSPARTLDAAAWRRLLLLAHVNKTRAFDEYAAHYLATDGQTYASDEQQTGVYVAHYHGDVDRTLGHAGSEMIAEWYVPRAALAAFLADAAECLRRERADPIYGTVRLIEPDVDSFLPWATQRWACVVLNLHVAHAHDAIARAAHTFRALNDLALARGGSFYLTYHRWASPAQVEAAYPQFRTWLERKRELDPREVYASDWHRHWTRALGARTP